MFCPRCATVNQNESRFCLKCGQPLQEGAIVRPLRPTKDTPKKSNWILAIVIPCAFVTVLGVLVALGQPPRSDNKANSKSVPTMAQASSVAGMSSEQAASDLSPEEYKAQCKTVSYKTIARDPNGLAGGKFTFTGEVIQVIEPSVFSDITSYRVNVTKNEYDYYEDTIIVEFRMPEDVDRILEGDIVKLWGESTGLYTYESILGAKITVPSVRAKYIGIIGS